MSKMDKILHINGLIYVLVNLRLSLSYGHDLLEDDSDLTCQAGTRWEDINHTLKDRGIPLFFPVSQNLCRRVESLIVELFLRSWTLDLVRYVPWSQPQHVCIKAQLCLELDHWWNGWYRV